MGRNGTATAAKADEPGFEEALRDLERVVDDLERGEQGLTEAMAGYGRGVALLARCHALLDGAEREVALLTGVDADGQPITAPFDDGRASAAPPPGVDA